MKKLLTTLCVLALALVCVLTLPTRAEAATKIDGGKYNGITWKVTSDKTLTLSGKGAVYNMGDPFPWRDCSGYVTKIVIKNGITEIGFRVFEGFSKLKSVSIPKSVKVIGTTAFKDCTALENVKISKGVTEISDSAFYGCTSLKKISLPSSVHTVGSFAFHNTAWYESQPTVGVIYIGKVAYGVKSDIFGELTIKKGTVGIADYAFARRPDTGSSFYLETALGISATSVVIPSSVKTIGEGAFCGCAGLRTLVISKGVETIGNHSFFGCASLGSLKIPAGVKSIGWGAFYNCNNLKKISVSSTVTEIGSEAFYNTAWYENQAFRRVIYVGKVAYGIKGKAPKKLTFKKGTVGIAGNAFDGTTITSVTIPGTVKNIGESAFNECKNLKTVKIGNGVKTIGVLAFQDCESLKAITIPNSVTKIGVQAFNRCTDLKTAKIGNGVKTIGESAFDSCWALETATLGKGVKTIGVRAFGGSYKIKTVLYRGSKSAWKKIKIADGNDYLLDATRKYNVK